MDRNYFSDADENHPRWEIDGIRETGFLTGSVARTETASNLPVVEHHNADTIPIRLLFNQLMHVFPRITTPSPISKLLQRFFQNSCAFQPSQTVSLMQPEALISPSLFLHQNDDWSSAGANPFFARRS